MCEPVMGLRAVCGFTEAKGCNFLGASGYLVCISHARADSLSAYRAEDLHKIGPQGSSFSAALGSDVISV
jgi:hypothetical protein